MPNLIKLSLDVSCCPISLNSLENFKKLKTLELQFERMKTPDLRINAKGGEKHLIFIKIQTD
jgi:hypothetical protein